MADDRRPIERAGQVRRDRIEQLLDADVLEARPAEHRLGPSGQGGSPQRRVNHGLGQLGPVEMGHVLLGKRLVEGRQAVEHRLAPGLGVEPELVGDFSDGERRAQVLGLEVKGLHGDQVDQPLELAHRPLRPGADGDLDRDRVALHEPLLDLGVDPLELGTDAVHLVDEAEPGDMILGRLPPDGLALGLDSLDRRKDDDRAVEHAERPLDLGGEVHVAGACR